jgi:hypothetical protein
VLVFEFPRNDNATTKGVLLSLLVGSPNLLKYGYRLSLGYSTPYLRTSSFYIEDGKTYAKEEVTNVIAKTTKEGVITAPGVQVRTPSTELDGPSEDERQDGK